MNLARMIGYVFHKIENIEYLTHYQMTNFYRPIKLKAFADNKINVNEKLKFGLERIENIVGKGENAGYQHFLLIS